jgi:tetratricopeptide (TPR) repeat protein
VHRDGGDRGARADALVALATIHQHCGQPDHARACAEQALTITRQASYRLLEGQALTTIAGIDLDQGRSDQARTHAQQAVDLHRTTGQQLALAYSLTTLGRTLHHTGGPDAYGCWQEALTAFTQVGIPEAWTRSPPPRCLPLPDLR